MRHLPKRTRFVALLAVGAIGLAACGTDDATTTDGTAQTEGDTTTDGATTDGDTTDGDTTDGAQMGLPADPFADLKAAAQPVGYTGSAKALAGGIAKAAGLEGDIDSPAAQTYATLATLLQEHVYLAGIAVDAGVSFGLDSDGFAAAAGALDANSVELADVVGTVAPDKRDAFLELWRNHIGHFVDYTKGVATGDDELRQTALDNLDQYRGQAGAFFEEISGGAIPADAVAESLSGHIQTLTTAIDAAVAGDTTVFSELKEAASHVGESGSAKALAGGIVQATGMEGDIDSPAVQAYVTLSTQLEEHVYLAGIAVKTAYAAGLDSDAFAAAADTLDVNSVELADLIGSVAPDQRDAFLGLWREHIGHFVDYAKGAAGGDEQAKQAALDNLAQYGDQAGAFFEQISGGEIPADAVKSNLEVHVETLTTAIDSLAAVLVS